jgi:SecDF, P1 head subdomain
MSSPTVVDDTPAPVEVLIPEARSRQQRRHRRSVILISIVALLVGGLVALLITTTSSGSSTAHDTLKPSTAWVGRASVLIRPVLCLAYPYVASQQKTGPVPPCAAAYQLTAAALNVSPNSAQVGYSSNTPLPDPATAGYPSSTHDSPTHTVLLGGLNGGPPVRARWVLGPSEMRLSASDVDSAAAQKNQTGQWIVVVHLSSAGAAAFDRVANENFHQFVAIDMGGKVVSTPIIQPTQTSFSSFEGVMQISGSLTASNARSVVSAIKG